MRKNKILMLSDLPLCASGVGVQSRFLIEGLLKTGRYSFRCLGGAIKHPSYETVMVNGNPDFIVKPVDGFGTPELIRQTLITERPDAVLLFTDPRQFMWLWEMEDEVHQFCPITYWHVWDNDPFPEFNRVWYESTDVINCLAHKTYDLVKPQFPEKTNYIPHSFPEHVYYKLPTTTVQQLRQQHFKDRSDWFIGLWINRNATRKMPNDVLNSFKLFLDNLEAKHGHRKAMLLLHTDPVDSEGPNLFASIEMLGLKNNVWVSPNKLEFSDMNVLHNMADFVINISKAEGFGLCISASTILQTTSQGMKNISEVEPGEGVLTDSGRFHRVLAKTSREGEVVRVTTQGLKRVECSAEHPFMVATNINTPAEQTAWIQAKDLSKGAYLVVALPESHCSRFAATQQQKSRMDVVEWLPPSNHLFVTEQQTVVNQMGYTNKPNGLTISQIQNKLGINKYYAENVRRILLDKPLRKGRNITAKLSGLSEGLKGIKANDARVEVNRFIDLTPEFFKVVGWYLAEGSNGGGSVVEFNLHAKEVGIANWLSEWFNTNLDVEGSVEVYGNKSRYYTSSSTVAQLFETLCGKGARNKELNKELYNCLMTEDSWKTKTWLSGLLSGLFNGDGHCNNRGYWSLASVSSTLIQQVCNLLLKQFEIPSSITCCAPSKSGNHSRYDLRINNQDKVRFNEIIEGTFNEEDCKSQHLIKSTTHNNWFYIPVKRVTATKEVKTLYDIQVDEAENFVANGIVTHNSVLSSLQVGRPVIASLTGGMIRQVVNHKTGYVHGVAIEPAARTMVGSQLVPYIYDDHVSHLDVADAYMQLFELGSANRDLIGDQAMQYVKEEFGYDNMIKAWDESLTACIDDWRMNGYKDRWTLTQLHSQTDEQLLPNRSVPEPTTGKPLQVQSEELTKPVEALELKRLQKPTSRKG